MIWFYIHCFVILGQISTFNNYFHNHCRNISAKQTKQPIKFVYLQKIFYSVTSKHNFMKHIALAVGLLFTATATFAQTKKVVTKPIAKPTQKPVGPTTKLMTELDSVAYSIGVNLGRNIKSQNLENLNTDLLVKGMRDVLKTDKGILDDMTCNRILSGFFQRQQQIQQAGEAKKYEAYKLAGEKFLVENKSKPGVTTLPSGLQYEIMKAGEGPKPSINDKVKTHYHGTLIDGTTFDSSVERGQPAEFPVGGVIQGWVEALQLMPVGSKWKLYVPYNLAYGERAAGQQIKPYSTLIFEVELLEILK
jgi:FKBP-type peptidyl-prolyl cis-trans isomerase FklB